jgi:hypothetical protein
MEALSLEIARLLSLSGEAWNASEAKSDSVPTLRRKPKHLVGGLSRGLPPPAKAASLAPSARTILANQRCPRNLTHVWAFASALSLTAACTPAETISTTIVNQTSPTEFLADTTDNLAPGDTVRLWHRSCAIRLTRHLTGCGYREIGTGVVTTVIFDSPARAFLRVGLGTHLALGDRATKDPPGDHWHPRAEPPSE